MFESFILGTIQGVAEWLPISSEGMISLVRVNFFGDNNLEDIIRIALFLHLGTFFSALIYFRKDVIKIIKDLFKYKVAKTEDKKLLNFLIVSTIISGTIGFILLKVILGLSESSDFSGRLITVIVGILLLLTAFLQLNKSARETNKSIGDLKFIDGVLLGIAQGFAVLPGLSRSGVTVATLLLRNFDDIQALRLSFLMSLPIVLGGNILLNMGTPIFSIENLVGLIFAFIFGLLTIHFLLKLAKKINFGYFVLIFGVLVVLSVFI